MGDQSGEVEIAGGSFLAFFAPQSENCEKMAVELIQNNDSKGLANNQFPVRTSHLVYLERGYQFYRLSKVRCQQ